MNPGLWTARKNHLIKLIKQVSDGYGGDDVAVFDQHCSEILCLHPGELIEDAIVVYSRMVEDLKYYGDRK